VETKITNAQCLLSFNLSDAFKASLFGNIESAGVVQYHYLLVVFGSDEQPCLMVASEWSQLDPSFKDEPLLGVFTPDLHTNFGRSISWRDEHLFLLRAVEIARQQFQTPDAALTEGEGWALTRILRRFSQPPNQHPKDQATDPTDAAYLDVLARNEGRLADFLKSTQATN
jgi:hypothetical protein